MDRFESSGIPLERPTDTTIYIPIWIDLKAYTESLQ